MLCSTHWKLFFRLRRPRLHDGPRDHDEEKVCLIYVFLRFERIRKEPTATEEKKGRVNSNVACGCCHAQRTIEVRSILGNFWTLRLLADDKLGVPFDVAHRLRGGEIRKMENGRKRGESCDLRYGDGES
jgi:hypothetical protein